MQGICDSCEENAEHLFDITRLPEFRGIVKRLNYRSVCQLCYDDLYDEARQQDTPEERRSEVRCIASLKVNLRGVDRNGQKFSEETVTEDISLSGARVKVKHLIEKGSVLDIFAPEINFEATVIVEVVWQDKHLKTVGFKLIEPSDVWSKMVSNHSNKYGG